MIQECYQSSCYEARYMQPDNIFLRAFAIRQRYIIMYDITILKKIHGTRTKIIGVSSKKEKIFLNFSVFFLLFLQIDESIAFFNYTLESSLKNI